MTDGRPAVTVLICRDLGQLEPGIDLVRLLDAGAPLPPAEIRVVGNLCQRLPLDGLELTGGRLVLGVCRDLSHDFDRDRSLRRAGIDPLGVQVVDLGNWCAGLHDRSVATERAALLLRAAVAAARAYVRPSPEALVPRLARGRDRASRRALLTLPPVRYQPVAVVDGGRCAAWMGCRLCVRACPRRAVAAPARTIEIDRDRCSACGICVPVCPRAAIDLPTMEPEQMRAVVDTLAAEDRAAEIGLLFLCDENRAALACVATRGGSYSPAWLPIVLPCVSALPAELLLGVLAAGLAAVAVIECGSHCSTGQAGRATGAVEFCRELLPLLGEAPARVRLLAPEVDAICRELAADPEAARRPSGSLPPDLAAAVLALAPQDAGARPARLEHDQSPLGLVEIDSQRCTGCGACALVCPTASLVAREDESGARILFDPARCIACGLCRGRCPEEAGTIVLRRMVDVAALCAGKRVLHRGEIVCCTSCGAPVASKRMLERIRSQLGDETGDSVLAAISRLCPSCRGVGSLRSCVPAG